MPTFRDDLSSGIKIPLVKAVDQRGQAMAMKMVGTFFQGQHITFVMQTQSTDTDEQKALVKDNDEYLGIYSESNSSEKIILSTADGTLTKTVADDGTVTVTGTLLPTTTKGMKGLYTVEVLIKSSDNTKAFPSENILSFVVEKYRLAEVITEETSES